MADKRLVDAAREGIMEGLRRSLREAKDRGLPSPDVPGRRVLREFCPICQAYHVGRCALQDEADAIMERAVFKETGGRFVAGIPDLRLAATGRNHGMCRLNLRDALERMIRFREYGGATGAAEDEPATPDPSESA